MRVIAGSAKGRRLAMVPGDTTRPITDRAKEALFSMLMGDLPGARVLDLFAGTGGVGIEALSRGAAWCDFIDLEPKAIRTVRANLSATGLSDRARVMRRDAFDFLGGTPHARYDVVFVAPPQYRGLWARAVKAIDAQPGWLTSDGIVVVQIHPRESLTRDALGLRRLVPDGERKYGSVLLQFWALADASTPDPVDADRDPAAAHASDSAHEADA